VSPCLFLSFWSSRSTHHLAGQCVADLDDLVRPGHREVFAAKGDEEGLSGAGILAEKLVASLIKYSWL
jgi:hypothetical protein